MHESFICSAVFGACVCSFLAYSTCSSSAFPSAPSKDQHFVLPQNKKPTPSWMCLLDETAAFQIARPINGVVEQGLTLYVMG